MKIHCNILSVLVLSILFGSCENNFAPHIYGSLNSENFPETQDEYESYAMLCYTPFTTTWVYFLGSGYNQHSMYIPEGGVLRLFDATSDIMAPWTTGWGGEWLRFSEADFSNCRYYWRGHSGADHVNHFQKIAEITRFTEILGTIESAPDNVFTGDKKRNLIGEVRLCRGLMMYYVMHMYGPLPVILDPEDVQNEEKLQDLERPTLDEMSDWIKEDFEYAVENVAENVAEKGRYTADYARYCLLRHCLNEGYHMSGYYERALEMYKELDNGKYSLFQKGDNPYAGLFSIENEFNPEIIMAVSCSETADGESKSGNFWPFSMLCVPANAAKTDDKGNPTAFYLQGGGWGQNFNVSPEFYKTFESGDKRKDVVITEYYTTSGSWVNSNNLGSQWDGYIINKYPIETATPFQGNDFPLARWADVLLMFAELDVRMSGSAPSQAAKDAVNAVRHRAGLADLAPEYTSDAENFLNAILMERGHELMYEGHRKIDLIRFNVYARAVSKYKGMSPTHQYMPLPDYAVEQARTYGKNLSQTYERPEYKEDLIAVGSY